jgi:hypothetical protein
VTSKFNKVKDKLTWKKKKDKTNLEDSKSQKFSSNGSLLSHNGLKPTLAVESETVKTVGGEHTCCDGRLQQQQQQQEHDHHVQQPQIFSISSHHIEGDLDHKQPPPHTIYSVEKGKFHHHLEGSGMINVFCIFQSMSGNFSMIGEY